MTYRRRRGLKWLYRSLTILGSIVFLLGAAGGAYLWLLHTRASIEGYRSPIRVQPRASGDPTPPLAPQVVIVLIDGLRHDAVPAMPTLAHLQRQGAGAHAIARAPTYSQPAWTTLVTGAWPEISGAPLLNLPESQLPPIATDHIFAAARRAGLSTALVGSSWWAKMIPANMLDAHFFAEGSDAAADQQIADTALRFLRNFHPSLMLVFFGNLDEVAHQAGTSGYPYREAAMQIDDHLRDLVEAIDLRRSVLIVVSDHGHVARGGHGGTDPDVTLTPFVAIGGPIIPGDYGQIAQTDIAPTVAAIVGAPVPRLSQGSIRMEMLRADPASRAEIAIGLAQQHREYGNLYLRSIGYGSLSDTAIGDVAVALSSYEVKNLESAYRLAQIATERIEQEVDQGRTTLIQRQRRPRLPLTLGGILAPLVILLLRGGRRGLWLLLSAVVTLALCHGISLRQGRIYSFSELTGQQQFIEQIAWPLLWASIAGFLLLLWRLGRDREDSALDVIQTGLGYSLLVVYLLGVQAALIYWLNGFTLTWYIPDFRQVFWLLMALTQAIVAVAIGVVLPIALILAGLVFQGVAAMGRRARPMYRR